MSRFSFVWSLVVLSTLAIALAGCSRKPSSAPAVSTPPAPAPSDAAESSPSDVPAAFASLSDADRAAALAQKVCPVSDQALGSMGTPIKVTIEGRDVFLCCEGCRDELLANPDEYLAKLTTPVQQP